MTLLGHPVPDTLWSVDGESYDPITACEVAMLLQTIVYDENGNQVADYRVKS